MLCSLLHSGINWASINQLILFVIRLHVCQCIKFANKIIYDSSISLLCRQTETMIIIINIVIKWQLNRWEVKTVRKLTCWPALRTNFQIANRQKTRKNQQLLVRCQRASCNQLSSHPSEIPQTVRLSSGGHPVKCVRVRVCACVRW